MSAPNLSAVLIAKDEEADLPGALDSLKGLADEIVVLVDPATADKTAEIARERGARVVQRVFDDYSRQKQAAVDLSAGKWILSIDADETVSSALAEEIRKVLLDPSLDAVAFEIPFQIRFLGRTLRWGGLGHEKHLRLFQRNHGRFIGGALHEGIQVDGRIGALRAPILHRPYRDLSEYLSKLDAYTTLAARKRFEAGRRAPLWRHLLLPGEFFLRAVVKLGVLDGGPGLAWAALAAFHSWLKYAKLAEMQRKARPL